MSNVNIAAETQALPLGYYLSGPLQAAIEAQALSAHSTVEFVETLGFDDMGELRTAEFTYQKSVADPGTGDTELVDVTLTVPLLSLVEAPHLAIEDLSVDFEFEIKEVISKQNQLKLAKKFSAAKEVSLKNTSKVSGKAGFLFVSGQASNETEVSARFKSSMNVSAAYARKTSSTVSREASLKMSMTAKQRVPEGFKKVLDIFADAISTQADTEAAPA